MKAKEDTKNQLWVYAQDYDPNHTIKDDMGHDIRCIDIWTYCEFFAEHIQERLDDTPDGLHLYQYADEVEKDPETQKALMMKLVEFTRDGRLYEFQMQMKEHGVAINAWALCNLCLFIKRIIECRWALLLRPRACDTLKELGDSPLESITLTTTSGSKTTTNNTQVLEAVRKVLQEEARQTQRYETDALVPLSEVMTKEWAQVVFFDYMERFLLQRFPFRRGKRGNATLLPEESAMIGYWLCWFGLSPAEVTESRLRQLRMKRKMATAMMSMVGLPTAEGETVNLQLAILKYEDWSQGRINPLKTTPRDLQVGDSMTFSPNTKNLLRLKKE